jgi:lipopolysaccharide export system permease protein
MAFMPIIWRYLLTQYIKIFSFCTVTIIAILLTSRLDDIAHFATLGPGLKLVLTFTFLQIPYILPIALPLSCLISSVIIFQRLSISHELTALRAAGFSIKKIFTPILLLATFISILNFYIVSELATSSHLQTNMLKTQVRSVNPLLLLRNKHLMRVKGYYFDTFGNTTAGESDSNVVLATPNKEGDRINLMIADELKATTKRFRGKGVSIITSIKSKDPSSADQLIIENVRKTTTSIDDFTKMIEKKVWSLNNDHLSLPLLLTRLDNEWGSLHSTNISSEKKSIKRSCYRCISELFKRISVGLAPFTFTLMGATFALSISRQKSKRPLIMIVILASLYLMCFFTAQGFGHQLIISSALYFVPHILIISLSLRTLSLVSHGVESKLI